MTVTYHDRGTSYAKQAGVAIKTEVMDHEPGHPQKTYAIGPDRTEYFPCSIDSFGNICDADGIVVYPSGSGAHPLERGEHGYFGEFSENYASVRDETCGLPSVSKVISLKSARKAAKLTQQDLADKSGVNIRQIQRIESGEADIGNVTLSNAVKLADAMGIDVRDLI